MKFENKFSNLADARRNASHFAKFGSLQTDGDKIRKVEKNLILQCAPLFIKRRIAALYMAKKDELESLVKICKDTGITVSCIGNAGGRQGMLLCHKSLLLEYFKNEGVKDILKERGYKNTELMPALSELTLRYRQYCIFRENFPHEMGLMLGYPVEDVRGYILNNGKNSLYSGCWKVYKRPSEKISLFGEFERAKHIMEGLSLEGARLPEIVQSCMREL